MFFDLNVAANGEEEEPAGECYFSVATWLRKGCSDGMISCE